MRGGLRIPCIVVARCQRVLVLFKTRNAMMKCLSRIARQRIIRRRRHVAWKNETRALHAQPTGSSDSNEGGLGFCKATAGVSLDLHLASCISHACTFLPSRFIPLACIAGGRWRSSRGVCGSVKHSPHAPHIYTSRSAHASISWLRKFQASR